eukprot:3002706-Rhodomonas_salina.1
MLAEVSAMSSTSKVRNEVAVSTPCCGLHVQPAADPTSRLSETEKSEGPEMTHSTEQLRCASHGSTSSELLSSSGSSASGASAAWKSSSASSSSSLPPLPPPSTLNPDSCTPSSFP